ncbi:putative membrane protein, partial [Yersinia pestis PY-14]
MFGCF